MIKIDDNFVFHDNDIIIIGCSSGPDSMALVDMLIRIREKYHLTLVVAHVNHNVRVESSMEEEFLKQYCQDHFISFESMVIEEYGDDNFHNEARNIRYHFFDTIVHKYHANYLMTAHHGDDLIETILMRIVRGSNIDGYSGFKKVVAMDDYSIVRPLISFTKQELVEYDSKYGVPYFIDSSNDKDTYTRNRYRKYILPFLKSEDSNVHLKFLQFSNCIEDASKYIVKERNKALKRVLEHDCIRISSFFLEDEYMQKEILYSILESFYQDDLILLRNKHIELLMKLLYSKRANASINLPNDVVAKKNYDYFSLTRSTDVIAGYEIEFDRFVFLPNHHSIESIDDCSSNSNNVCRLNSTEIELPLIIRTRKMGDRMKVKGLNGSKKVKDIFIDKKISISARDSWPIVVDSSGKVLWIPGIKKSVFDKTKSESYDIILKYS